jgi:hypothetical protein
MMKLMGISQSGASETLRTDDQKKFQPPAKAVSTDAGIHATHKPH